MSRTSADRLSKGCLVVLLLICLVALALVVLLPERPAKLTTATVTTILDRPAEYRRVVDVTFRSSDGLVGRATMRAADVNCAVGDRVRAERVGVSLRLAPGACRKTESGSGLKR